MLRAAESTQQLKPKSSAEPSGDTTENIELRKILQDLAADPKDSFQYDYFLMSCKQKQASSAYLTDVVHKLRPLVHMLDPKLFEAGLVNMLFFDIKWSLHSRNEALLDSLAELLIDLNSAYTCYIYKCLNMLLKSFLSHDSSDQPLTDSQALHEFSHKLIGSLIRIAPTCKNHLIKQIDALYPYMTKDTLVQEAYISNVLRVSEYVRELRLPILEICVQKLLKIDVSCTREQISEAELNAQAASDQAESAAVMHLPLADRLDAMMEKMLLFIKQSASRGTEAQPATAEEDWEACKSIYKDLLFTFDKYVMRTYGSSHVQFLMFYMCSYKGMLSEGFIDYLWKKFSNPASCQVTKQICTYYIGSFLARSKYVNIATCSATLTLIVAWLNSYIDKFSAISTYSAFDTHRTFYALCQTLFYVVIFRHQQLFAPNSETAELVKSWRLNDIVSSKLNPLKYCLPAVRKKFSRVTYVNQVAYCYSIIDANNRVSLPTTSESAMNQRMFCNKGIKNQNNDSQPDTKTKHLSAFLENPLDSFFPFDPYLLKRSKSFIEKHYQDFQSVVDDQIDMDSDVDVDEDEMDSDTDTDISEAENGAGADDDVRSSHLEEEDSDIENSIY